MATRRMRPIEELLSDWTFMREQIIANATFVFQPAKVELLTHTKIWEERDGVVCHLTLVDLDTGRCLLEAPPEWDWHTQEQFSYILCELEYLVEEKLQIWDVEFVGLTPLLMKDGEPREQNPYLMPPELNIYFQRLPSGKRSKSVTTSQHLTLDEEVAGLALMELHQRACAMKSESIATSSTTSSTVQAAEIDLIPAMQTQSNTKLKPDTTSTLGPVSEVADTTPASAPFPSDSHIKGLLLAQYLSDKRTQQLRRLTTSLSSVRTGKMRTHPRLGTDPKPRSTLDQFDGASDREDAEVICSFEDLDLLAPHHREWLCRGLRLCRDYVGEQGVWLGDLMGEFKGKFGAKQAASLTWFLNETGLVNWETNKVYPTQELLELSL
ncbi:hypothetical protein H2201_005949 [Coniosporium apollinis]|uniref:Uncharacterized protein n=1 Tax=Coniosporium apollinis TaxID=61459 RepID=A0ABQ9NN98_9PEZI|nr:hypothetical protein H2201_005949 [Coniosporium apollinis]